MRLAHPRAAKSSIAALARLRVVEIVQLAPDDVGMPDDDGLRNSVSRFNGVVFIARIEQDDHELAAIIGVDSARRIEHGDAMTQSESAARSYFDVIAFRNAHAYARVDERSAMGFYRKRFGGR